MEKEKRLIDVNALAVDFCECDEQFNEEPWTLFDILGFLNDAPTVDAAEVVHGRWLSEMHGNSNNGTCSVCGSYEHAYAFGWNYCPNCGAKMDDMRCVP